MRLRVIAVALILAVGFLLMRGGLVADIFGGLAFGWAAYLMRVVPQARIAWAGVATAVLCLALFAVGLHRSLRWLVGEVRKAAGGPPAARPAWRIRWTASVVAIVVAMFAVGIAAAGIAHQTGWLIASRRTLLGERTTARRSLWGSSSQHLKQFGMGLSYFVEAKPRGMDKSLQSWQTEILPGMSYVFARELRKDLPWDEPENSAYFRAVIPEYLNPEVATVRSLEGYGLSHYAGNVHVLGRKPLVWPRDAANTIVAGEVAEGFRPWGDPTNLRDPGLGINTSPDGFGGPSGTGANFLFADGSVRFLPNTTDRTVLRRLARPDPDG